MKIQLTAPTIWLATQPTDFRRSINGLSAMVINDYQQTLQDQVYIFYNRAKNKLKILARHRNGAVLVYKQFDKKKVHGSSALMIKRHEVTEKEEACAQDRDNSQAGQGNGKGGFGSSRSLLFHFHGITWRRCVSSSCSRTLTLSSRRGKSSNHWHSHS